MNELEKVLNELYDELGYLMDFRKVVERFEHPSNKEVGIEVTNFELEVIKTKIAIIQLQYGIKSMPKRKIFTFWK